MRRSLAFNVLGLLGAIALAFYLVWPLVIAVQDGVQSEDRLVAERVQTSLQWMVLFAVGLALTLAVTWVLIVVVHELGHLLAGTALGFEPVYFLVGPLMVDLGGAGLRLRINPLRRQYGGAVVFILPARPARQLAGRWAWTVAAGPAANLLFGLALLGLVWSGAADGRFEG